MNLTSFSTLKLFIVSSFFLCQEANGQSIEKDIISVIEQDSSNYFLQSGIAKYRANNYGGAILEFEKAIKISPNVWKTYRFKGMSERKLRRYSDAILSFTKAISINSSDTISLKGRAESKRMNGQYRESLSDYDIVIRWDSKDSDMYFGRASAFFGLHEYEKAINDYTTCLQFDSNDELSYVKRGLAYVEKAQYLKAKADLSKYLKLGGREEGAYYYLGLCNVYLGEKDASRTDSAIYYLGLYTQSKNPANSNDPSGYQFLGMAYAQKRDSVKSHENFRKSITLDPENKEVYFQWGIAEMTFSDFGRADQLFAETYKRIKSPSADFYNQYGLAKAGLRDTLAALDYFKSSLAIDSSKREVYENRIVLAFNSNKYHKVALSDLDHLIIDENDEKEKAEWHSLKSMIDVRVKDTTSARVEVEKAIKMMPDEPMHYMVRALVNSVTNDSMELVMKDINKAIRIDPTMTEAYLFKATYYGLHGDHKNGCEVLKFALKIGATVPRDIENYICKGKIPKSGKAPELFIPINPRLIRIRDGSEQ